MNNSFNKIISLIFLILLTALPSSSTFGYSNPTESNTLVLSPDSISTGYRGITAAVTVTGSIQVPTGLTAIPNESWIHVTNIDPDINRIFIFVDVNKGLSRTGTITVNASNVDSIQHISITQASAPNNLSSSPSLINIGYRGTTTAVTVSGSLQSPAGITAIPNASWIHVTHLDPDLNRIFIFVDVNKGAARSGTITVCSSNAENPQTIMVNQASAQNNLILSQDSIYLGYRGITNAVTVSGTIKIPTGVTATPNQSWIHVTNIDPDLNRIFIFVDVNNGAARNGTITVNASNASCPQTLSFIQEAAPDNLSPSLDQNFPNPFNPITNISYYIPEAGNVSLKIYDVIGKEIAVLTDEYKSEGSYTVEFDGSNLSSGIYFYELKANNFLSVKKLLLTK